MRLKAVLTLWIPVVLCKIDRHYVTEECGQVLGPEDGAYLEFDREVKKKNDVINIPEKLKGTLFECMIVIRGMPATQGETKHMSLHWRNFYWRDQAVETIQSTPAACQKAYVTIYNGIDRTAPELGTYCGKDILDQNVEFVGTVVTLYFYADYRNPNLVTTPAPAVTIGPDETTPADTFPYPLAYIKLDVTNFDYACNESIPGVVMRCNDSQRCINDDLRCDFYYSRNCVSPQFPRDRSDAGRHPPALCWVLPTTTTVATTTEPPPPVPFPWPAVVGPVAGILALLAFAFCCCRPGYFAWRCGRGRNVPCLASCGACMSPCCNRCMGPCCNKVCPCCAPGYGPSATGAAAAKLGVYEELNTPSVFGSPGTNGSNGPTGWPGRRTSSVAPADQPVRRLGPWGKRAPGHSNIPNGIPSSGLGSSFDDRDDPEGLATGWLKFLSNDGGHLREQR